MIAEGRARIGGRSQLVGIATELANHLRGVMKTFGLVVAKGGGRIFETNVRPFAIAERDCSALAALSSASMIEDPANFKNARAVGAYVGLAARSYQSGEIDYDGHILKARRQTGPLGSLYEAAAIVLTRVRSPSALRSWDLKLMQRAGFRRAVGGVARKLAVILHAMWRDGIAFDPMIAAA